MHSLGTDCLDRTNAFCMFVHWPKTVDMLHYSHYRFRAFLAFLHATAQEVKDAHTWISQSHVPPELEMIWVPVFPMEPRTAFFQAMCQSGRLISPSFLMDMVPGIPSSQAERRAGRSPSL